MSKPDIVGLLIIEQTGVATLAGKAGSISELLWGIEPQLIKETRASLNDGGVLKMQVFELSGGDVLMELTIDCKKPFEEILKYQPND